jgi:hypothetical protein
MPYRIAAAVLSLGCFVTGATFVFSETQRQPVLSAVVMGLAGLLFAFAAITGWKGRSA